MLKILSRPDDHHWFIDLPQYLLGDIFKQETVGRLVSVRADDHQVIISFFGFRQDFVNHQAMAHHGGRLNAQLFQVLYITFNEATFPGMLLDQFISGRPQVFPQDSWTSADLGHDVQDGHLFISRQDVGDIGCKSIEQG